MSDTINHAIKTALENAVLCRGANPAKESYDYAQKMERYIKNTIADKLDQIIDSEESTNELLEELVEELRS